MGRRGRAAAVSTSAAAEDGGDATMNAVNHAFIAEMEDVYQFVLNHEMFRDMAEVASVGVDAKRRKKEKDGAMAQTHPTLSNARCLRPS